MTRKIKIIVGALGVLSLTIAITAVYTFSSLSSALDSWSPPPNAYLIRFDEVGETVYMRARTWGLGGNHQEIIVANSPIATENQGLSKDRQIVYLDDTELYYKKVGTDTLEIYVGILTEIPKEFSSRVKIKQFKIDFDEARYLADHYQDKGLSKVSVYPIN